MVYIIVKKGRNTRRHDMEIISRGLRDSDPNVRRQAQHAYEQVRKESGKVESMRQALVEAHREGNKEEVKDIHSFIEKKSEYKNG